MPSYQQIQNRIRTLSISVALSFALLCGGTRMVHADQANPKALGAEQTAQAEARKLFARGIELYNKRKYKDAIDAFVAADRLFPSSVISFNTARAYDDLGDTSGALRFYRSYLRQAPDAADRAEVEARVGDLESKLRAAGVQQVTILSEPDAATVTLDDRPVGVTPWSGEIHPGKHRLKLSRDGYVDATTDFVLPTIHAIDVKLDLEPMVAKRSKLRSQASAATREPKQSARVRPLTIGVLGAGALGFAGAGVFELMRRSSENAARDERTQVGRAKEIEREDTRRTTSMVFAGVGAIATTVGGVLLYLDLSSAPVEKQPVSNLAGGGSCGASGCSFAVRGRFQ